MLRIRREREREQLIIDIDIYGIPHQKVSISCTVSSLLLFFFSFLHFLLLLMGSTPWLDCHEHMHLRGASFHVLGLGPCLHTVGVGLVELLCDMKPG